MRGALDGDVMHKEPRIRRALATNVSDLLRYQNMLCRYDTVALKWLEVFSVHGFPRTASGEGRGVRNERQVNVDRATGAGIGSGGFSNITAKYAKAKGYCDEFFEIRHSGSRKTVVPIKGERIGGPDGGPGATSGRTVRLEAVPAGALDLAPDSLDAVLTDPPGAMNRAPTDGSDA
ncbi:MAG: hypothetical protein FJX72_00915 [Armatimonadetes bacterium]|nr:hypothetical protein [Armatimonadota bacterium]